ncbi:MAG: 6-bladed beta-propeller [Candidatus Zhuqueibacterota bacterium]
MNRSMLAVFLFFIAAHAGDNWKGEIKIIDGVTHVLNTTEPLNPKFTISLEKQVVLGDDINAEEFVFEQIIDGDADENGNIYLLDFTACHVLVFDKTGELIKTIGRKGQGPGEFTYPMSISIVGPDTFFVAQANPNRFTFFNFQGEHIKDFTLVFTGTFTKARLFSPGKLIYSKSEFSMKGEKSFMKLSLNTRDIGQENDAVFFETEKEMDFMRTKKVSQKSTPTLLWTFDKSGSVYAVDDVFDYKIKVADCAGEVFRLIVKKFSPVKKTKEEVEKEMKQFDEIQERMGVQIDFDYETSPEKSIISTLLTDEKGRLWVITPEDAPKDGMAFDVFNSDGKFLNKIKIESMKPGNLFIKGNHLYSIYRDEDELSKFARYKIIEK